ncbi:MULTISPECIES: hypothetical protein [unclassified Bacteroides]|jgi:hypothetical protein|uniref:hypothetical protein n=1 Tax=unclassified Bacteroides TaxID=2646097 RepID=UPI000E896B27|nr:MULTISPECIES: hypothetical protein [unclassified Bacteroides]RGN43812.1 hypothetical protein DXB63_15245 [Bacteroides sp. OM05-12]RHR73839.1 hypothetical protein DWW69_14350 [Bacteroides sp. AF16-49]
MKVLDKELDQKPTPQKVKKMAELRIRNLLAFSELQSYNDTGKWRYKHPIIAHQSERSQLEELRRTNPQEFLRQYAACHDNIKRYTSYLKNPSREVRREKDRINLTRHKEREILFKSILESTNNN